MSAPKTVTCDCCGENFHISEMVVSEYDAAVICYACRDNEADDLDEEDDNDWLE